MTGVRFNSQYGMVEAAEDGRISNFAEKPLLPYWVNGGFMLYETQMLDINQKNYRDDLFEIDIMPTLMADGELMLYRHTGYWQSMKTLQDYITLKDAWQRERPWQVWRDGKQ
jgi:glucose-1-phosphate cytidylyltransferase